MALTKFTFIPREQYPAITTGIAQVQVPAGTSIIRTLPVVNSNRPITITAIPLTKLEHGVVTDGPFVVGDVVAGSESGASGQVVEVGADYLLVADVSGTFDASTPDTLTGSISTATANITTKTVGSALARDTTSAYTGTELSIDGGTAIFSDWAVGTVQEITKQALYSGISAIKLTAIDIDAIFEIVV